VGVGEAVQWLVGWGGSLMGRCEIKLLSNPQDVDESLLHLNLLGWGGGVVE